MNYRPLGSTALSISALAFGAGPVSRLMTAADEGAQTAVVRRALEAGINWFDTAATYGGGASERSLGATLERLNWQQPVHVATKVRLDADDLSDIDGAVRRSVCGSLERLRCDRVTCVQLHNAITHERGDEPTSITPQDVLGANGVLAAFERLRREGVVDLLGLTGTGAPAAMKEVIHAGSFDTLQVPYHLFNATAGAEPPAGFRETDYGNVIAECRAAGMGVLAIRVFGAGAILDAPPSPHTLKTPFFPLDLYERDRARAQSLAKELPPGESLADTAVRFVLEHEQIASAIIGFGEPQHVDAAARSASRGPLTTRVRRAIVDCR